MKGAVNTQQYSGNEMHNNGNREKRGNDITALPPRPQEI